MRLLRRMTNTLSCAVNYSTRIVWVGGTQRAQNTYVSLRVCAWMAVEYVAHQYLSRSRWRFYSLLHSSDQIVYLSVMNALSSHLLRSLFFCACMCMCAYGHVWVCNVYMFGRVFHCVFMLRSRISVRVKEKWTMAIVASFTTLPLRAYAYSDIPT